MRWNLPITEKLRLSLGERLRTVPHDLFWGTEAAAELASALRAHVQGDRLCVLFDARTYDAAGPECLSALKSEGWSVREVLVDDHGGHSPACDDRTHDELNGKMPDCDGLVALGSGVINDLGKWLGVTRGAPYAVYATAASMNGYSSANVAATLRGVKSLVPARAACVVAANPNVISAAPSHMAAAGLGDMLAKPFSSSDWFINHVLFAEAFEPELIELVEPFERVYLEHAKGIAAGEPRVLQALFQGLVVSGCAMTLHGSSLPASGGEHLISHTLDMMAARDDREHDLHGRQVGVAAIFIAGVYERLLSVTEERFVDEAAAFDSSFWGKFAEQVAEQHKLKVEKVTSAVARLHEPGVWESAKRGVTKWLRSPELVRDALRAAGGATVAEELIGVTETRWKLAVRNAGAMRARLTSIDLALSARLLDAHGR